MSRLRHLRADDASLSLLPFAAAAVAALTSIGSPSGSRSAWLWAISLTVALVLGTFLVPWRRIQNWYQVIVPLTFLVIVGLLRHVEGGAVSGFSSLLLLSVVWIALYGRTPTFITTLAGIAVILAAPILMFGAPAYPIGEWRRLVITLLVGVLMGIVIQHLVRQNAERAQELSAQAQSLEAIAATLRDLPVGDDPRKSVCEAVLKVGSADRAWLLEPDGEHLVVSAHAGQAELQPTRIPLKGEQSGSVKAFTTGLSFFVAMLPQAPKCHNDW